MQPIEVQAFENQWLSEQHCNLRLKNTQAIPFAKSISFDVRKVQIARASFHS
jgi:hypothetical protein